MEKVKLDQIKLANSIKNGRNENILFNDSANFRDHGHHIELVAVKMPVVNSPGDYLTQALVKITDKQSKEITYTSLANAIYFRADLAREKDVKPKRKATI